MRGRALCASIFFRQHDRQYTCDDWFSMCALDIWLLIQVDLEKDRVAVGFQRPKVVLSIWIVGVTEVIVDLDRLDDAGDHFTVEGGDAHRYDYTTVAQGVTQRVVERAN